MTTAAHATTIDLTHPEDWPEQPCPNGLADARAWAAENGYPLEAVPVTPEAVKSAADAHVAVAWAVCLLDRATAIEVGLGYYYARDIDEGPRDDTRAAAIREGKGYEYARYIDGAPRDDTRAAAIREGCGYRYARWVDHCPRAGTRAAAIAEGYGDRYDEWGALPP